MVESKSDYRALKRNKGTVTIKVEEVLKPIFIKGLLSRREMQVVFAIIAHSWRWGNRQYTQRPVDLHELSKETGLNYANLTRIWRSLIERRVIRVDDRKRASFNEHHEDWKNLSQATVKTTTSAGKLSKRQQKLSKRQLRPHLTAMVTKNYETLRSLIRTILRTIREARKKNARQLTRVFKSSSVGGNRCGQAIILISRMFGLVWTAPT